MENLEIICVNGFEFRIGFQSDEEFSDIVFEIKKNNKWYGVAFCGLTMGVDGIPTLFNEIGWNTGIIANESELSAISAAREISNSKGYSVAK